MLFYVHIVGDRELSSPWLVQSVRTRWRREWAVFVSERYMLSPVRLCRLSVSSVVCNIRAPYSGSSNFRQYF